MGDTTLRKRLDSQLTPLRSELPALPAKGWISMLRHALSMTTKQLGKRVGVAQNTISALEQSERARTITLESLDRLANAMDCEVHYFLIPRESLTKTIQRQAEKKFASEQKSLSRTMALENQEVIRNDRRDSLEFAMYLLENEHRIWDES